MTRIQVGETIFLPVDSAAGAFQGECLITFKTLDGPISGFIKSDQIREKDGKKFIPANVVNVMRDLITVRLHGSFFTTTGLAHIDKETPYLVAA